MNTRALTQERNAAWTPQVVGTAFLAFALLIFSTLQAPAQDRPETLADLAELVSPSVVNITTTTTVAGRTGPQGIVPEGSPFEDFFEDLPSPDGRPRSSSALGSGFVISADGFIVTNNHVIEGADEIMIEFFPGGGELREATLVGTDPNTDIALLKVEVEAGEALPYVDFGDSDVMRVGDWVVAMGNPLGQGFSVSAGIVSARNRALQGTYDDYIQTDAAINRGNSGGPLFNLDGDVIGVNTAILSPNGGSIGIGFAMSSSVVTRVVDQLKEFGETRRGWLGVRIQDVTPDMVDAIEGLTVAEGALITDVPPGPAADAGLQAGDVILNFAGQEVDDTRGLVRVVGNSPVGETVDVLVLRDGEEVIVPVTLGRRETAEASFPAAEPDEPEAPAEAEILGLTVMQLTEENGAELGVPEGTEGLVITAIAPDSEAAEKGLEPGDVITEAGQQRVGEVADLVARVDEGVEEGRKSILLLVRRGGDPRFVALTLPE